MSISDQDDQSDLIPEQHTSIESGLDDELDAGSDAGTSEVAMRISLLGKLIIPPSVPRA